MENQLLQTLNITKGKKGDPGEIRGTIESGHTIGNIDKNTSFGVFGTLNKTPYINIQNNVMKLKWH